MQSKDYVPGVSGWKIDKDGRFELNDGNHRINAASVVVTWLRNETAARAQAEDVLVTRVGTLIANSNGQRVAAGAGVGIHFKPDEPKVHFPDAFRDLIREELHKALKPGGLLHRR